MNLRCKDGDIAVITWDHLGCLENIGRIVMVRGPAHQGDFGICWRIRPITEDLYAFVDLDNSIGRERVGWQARIDHPDAWMLPIRPTDEEEAQQAHEVLEAR